MDAAISEGISTASKVAYYQLLARLAFEASKKHRSDYRKATDKFTRCLSKISERRCNTAVWHYLLHVQFLVTDGELV
jgi:hypothetical protein